jgi:hypothetical protein
MTISTIPPLDLETARPSASTGSLKLATLASDIRFLVLVGTETEVLDGFSGVLGTAEKESVGSSRGAQSEFIQSQSLTTGLVNASSGSGSETQGSDGKLGDGKETVVISDRADHDNGFALARDKALPITAKAIVRWSASGSCCLRNNDRQSVGTTSKPAPGSIMISFAFACLS